MTNRHKQLALLLFLLAMLLLFPPWRYTYSEPGMAPVEKPAKRAFLFSPPHPEEGAAEYGGVAIDLRRLLLEMFAVGLLGGAFYFFWNAPRK